ncbi:MAG: YraN family protein [Acutalibacteraceae bacterium]
MTASQIGKAGEDFCCRFYEKAGYQILARNYHSRMGEIDVIAQNASFIVFAEVKTRAENSIAPAKEAVTASKQKKLMLTALDYISKNTVSKQMRFDVFEVIHRNGKIIKFRNNENSFEFDERLTNGFSW